MYPDKDFERRLAENAERVANLFDGNHDYKSFRFEVDEVDINRIAEGLKRCNIANVLQKATEE